MLFKELKYFNFRNIANGSIHTDSRNVILEGCNGQGKTNILESVYILSYGSSFRTANVKEAIAFGQQRMHIAAIAQDEDGQLRKVEYINQQGKRRIMLDGKTIHDRKDLIYSFPVIVFSHEDIDFVKGEPEYRRRFFDQTFSMYDPLYLDSLRSYRSILAQRNAAIKSGQLSLITLYDERLARHGLEISHKRMKGVEDFNRIFPDLYRRISGSDIDITIRYQRSWKDLSSVDEVMEYLESTRDRDIRMMTTSSGIHRDRFTVYDQNGPFVQMTGKLPVILVDDVLLELDASKRASFLSLMDGYSQAFFTFLPDEKYFAARKDDMIEYVVEEGKVGKKAQ